MNISPAKVPAKIRHAFLLCVVMLALASCGGTTASRSPWNLPMDTGIVTKDPKSLPDIAWQTPQERNTLQSQSHEYAKAQTEAETGLQHDYDAGRPAPGTPAQEAADESMRVVKPLGAPRGKSTVALLVPLSGKYGDLGQSMLKAAQLALFDVGGENIELVPRDTRSTPEGAAAAAREALSAGAQLILGPVFAEDLKAVRPVAGATPVVAFTTDWTQGGGNTYIMGFMPFAQVARVVRYAESRGLYRFGVYAPETEYTDVVIQTMRRVGADLKHVVRYSPQQADLDAVTRDFAAISTIGDRVYAYDALMLPTGGESLRTVASILDGENLRSDSIRFLGTGLWDDASLAQFPAVHGGWYAAPDPKLRSDFESRYEQNYGAPPARIASLAYDATALASVLARTAPGMPFSRANMVNPRGFAGIDGIFRFRDDGLAERGLAVLELQASGPKIIDPAPTAFSGGGS